MPSITQFAMEFTNVGISEVIFKERLAKTDYSMVFLVDIRGETCVMKVVSVHSFCYSKTN